MEDGCNYHEYMFVYKADFTNESDRLITETIQNVEGENHLSYMWIDLDKIDTYDLRPKIMKTILKENKFPTHKINIDY